LTLTVEKNQIVVYNTFMKIVKKILLILAVLLVLSLNFCGYHLEGDGGRQESKEEEATLSMAGENCVKTEMPLFSTPASEVSTVPELSSNSGTYETAPPSIGLTETTAPEESDEQDWDTDGLYIEMPSVIEFEGEKDY
jgi:hypothetical protein